MLHLLRVSNSHGLSNSHPIVSLSNLDQWFLFLISSLFMALRKPIEHHSENPANLALWRPIRWKLRNTQSWEGHLDCTTLWVFFFFFFWLVGLIWFWLANGGQFDFSGVVACGLYLAVVMDCGAIGGGSSGFWWCCKWIMREKGTTEKGWDLWRGVTIW